MPCPAVVPCDLSQAAVPSRFPPVKRGCWPFPLFALGGQLASQPDVLMSLRGGLARVWLGALGHGEAGVQRGSTSHHPLFVLLGSTPKSRAASASDFSKVVNSSFSESAWLGFQMRSSARFWNILLLLTNTCCSLMSPKKEA